MISYTKRLSKRNINCAFLLYFDKNCLTKKEQNLYNEKNNVILGGNMEVQGMIELLEKAGTTNQRKRYQDNGVTPPFFGVELESLIRIAKNEKTNHILAQALWETKIIDCQILATMIFDIKSLSVEQLTKMVHEINHYDLLGAFVHHLARHEKSIDELIDQWLSSDQELVKCGAFLLVGYKAIDDTQEKTMFFVYFIQQIVKDLFEETAYLKRAMLNCLLFMSGRNQDLYQIVSKVVREYELDSIQQQLQSRRRLDKNDFYPFN